MTTVRTDDLGFGIVIPARDEAERIASCLSSLAPFREAGDRVVVVDAASRDDTARMAESSGALVIRTDEPARGLAIAQGYDEVAAEADVVLVVHADMTVPAAARERIVAALAASPDAVGGALGHRIADARLKFRWVERGNRFRARRGQLPYGDQAQFVRVAAVERAGGFPRIPRFEDLELSLRLRRLGRWLYLDCPVGIPARHWDGGVVRTTLGNWVAALGHRFRRSA